MANTCWKVRAYYPEEVATAETPLAQNPLEIFVTNSEGGCDTIEKACEHVKTRCHHKCNPETFVYPTKVEPVQDEPVPLAVAKQAPAPRSLQGEKK